ncbi:uncharacterized protein LOC144349574 isoform X2 [Saccoglossus kowalevskii]
MELQQISSERESRQRLVDDDRVHGEYRAVYQQRSIQDARVNDDGFRVIIHQPTPQPTQQMYRSDYTMNCDPCFCCNNSKSCCCLCVCPLC